MRADVLSDAGSGLARKTAPYAAFLDRFAVGGLGGAPWRRRRERRSAAIGSGSPPVTLHNPPHPGAGSPRPSLNPPLPPSSSSSVSSRSTSALLRRFKPPPFFSSLSTQFIPASFLIRPLLYPPSPSSSVPPLFHFHSYFSPSVSSSFSLLSLSLSSFPPPSSPSLRSLTFPSPLRLYPPSLPPSPSQFHFERSIDMKYDSYIWPGHKQRSIKTKYKQLVTR